MASFIFISSALWTENLSLTLQTLLLDDLNVVEKKYNNTGITGAGGRNGLGIGQCSECDTVVNGNKAR